MTDQNKHTADDDQWLDEILGKENVPRELGIDELAVAAAGLLHPEEADLERIVQETMAEQWGDDTAQPVLDGQESFVTAQQPILEDFSFPEDIAEPATAPEAFDLPEEPEISEVPEVPVEPEISEMPEVSEISEVPEAPVAESADVPRKARPKAKNIYGLLGIPHIAATVIWIVLIVFIGVAMGRLAWVCASDLLALGKSPKEATITISEQDDLTDVSEKLHKVGMIRYPNLFKLFAEITGKGDGILVGTITFHPDTVYDYNALVNAMSYRGGATVTVSVMIPEGYSCAQIFSLLDEKGVCNQSELEAYAADGELKEYWFLKGISRGHKYCLEGFLFPDTYEFYLDDEPEHVITKLLDNFDVRFSSGLMDKYNALNARLGLNLSIYDAIKMASIVEKEATDQDGYEVASVYYNRMRNSGAFPFLNCDATILYATEYRDKDTLTTDAAVNDSPFNTYTHPGLPPTPIANPGLASLEAALDPSDTNYYYYVLDKQANVHRFSSTLQEHEQLMRQLGYLS